MSDDAGPTLMTADDRALAFAEKLIELLDRTGKTATYKFAVLMGLIDVCQERFSKDGFAPTSVTTYQLAEAVVAIYWRQARSFQGSELRQITSRTGRSIADHVRAHRVAAAEAPLGRFRIEHATAYAALVDEVEGTLVNMPLPRLQKFGRREVRFIYQIGWDDQREIGERERRDPARFDNLIRFVDGAGDHLVRLSGLLRPVIKRRWALMVSDLNRLTLPEAGVDSALEHHLFGGPRSDLTPVRGHLRELQDGRCFYCGETLRTPQVDHFIPWARVPLDAIENLVLADGRCNGDKGDSLPATDHVSAWASRLHARAPELATIADDLGWETAPDRALGLARSIYLPITPDALLWTSIDTFVRPDKARLFDALA